jgi:AcrR family transcriptional regulator
MEAGDKSTEEKIKAAARKVFHNKGYAGTKTRDIAEEAGINLALLNYYFRSKEKLFEIVMFETMRDFFQSLASVFNNPETSFEQKLSMVVENYITLLSREPEIPLFIMSEIRSNPELLVEKMNVREMILNSVFGQQMKQLMAQKNIPEHKFVHLIMNFIGLTVFPFVARPIVKSIGNINDEQFYGLMQERKTLIPVWVKAILESM